jgi:hypothetical protein
MTPDNTQISLDKGELSCILQKTNKGTQFEIKTPVAICGARGTGWRVTHNPKTTGYCFENRIYMQMLNQQGEPTGDQSNINEGHKKTIGANGFIGPTKRIGSWQKRRWNSWMRDLGKFCSGNLPGSTGKTADPYTPVPGGSSNLNKDANDLNNNSDGQSKDAKNDKVGEQNVQGAALRDNLSLDSDGDGVLDVDDLFPNNPNRASGNDLDSDGIDDEFDSDIDGDGYANGADAFPRDKHEWADNDLDGVGDNADLDDDNDGMPDIWELVNGTDPKVDDAALDPDNDGLTNAEEMANNTDPLNDDTDGDTLLDGDELTGNTLTGYVTDPTVADTDGDGPNDFDDKYPLDENEETDFDMDVAKYWNLMTGQPEDTNLFMPQDNDGFDNLYPADNEDAFVMDDTIDGQKIYRNGDGNLTYTPNGEAIAYGLIVTNIKGEQEIVRGYGSRWEMQRELADMIEEAKGRFEIGQLRNDVNQFKADIAAREKDARLTQVSDAQLHKVMTDRQGNRVRVEQYVLRPVADDNSVIQLLNVNLRTAGDFAGLTTLNWTMDFNRNIEGDTIKDLPWEDYLTIIETGSGYGISSTDPLYTEANANDAYIPEKMLIQLVHNDNAVTEMTTFGARQQIVTNYEQNINAYNLSLQTPAGETELFNDYTAFKDATIATSGANAEYVSVLNSDTESTAWNFVNFTEYYKTETRTPAEVFAGNFIVINNDGLGTGESIAVAGLSDMLRVGYFDLDNGSNLEALFSYLDMTGSGYSQSRTITAYGPNPDESNSIVYGEWTPSGSLLSGTSLFSSTGIDCILVPVDDQNWETGFDWWGGAGR